MSRRNQRRWRILGHEEFERRICLSAVAFIPHDMPLSEAAGASSVISADLDSDGDLDLLAAASVAEKIMWYENLDGQGNFGPQQLIGVDEIGADRVYAADADGDGDLDVFSAGCDYHCGHNRIAWYENLDGQGNFSPRRLIVVDVDGGGFSESIADLDGDGDVDVVAASLDGAWIEWYENTDGGGTFRPPQQITSGDGVDALFVVDVDGDGKPDVLTASESEIGWYANDGGGEFTRQQSIALSPGGRAHSLDASDLDADGDLDVIVGTAETTTTGRIYWYENLDGEGIFGSGQALSSPGGRVQELQTADMDGDGDLDVLAAASTRGSAAPDEIAWYENTDGKGDFGPRQVITTAVDGAESVHVGDIDGDGDFDVFSASSWDDKLAWFENTDGRGTFGAQQVIAGPVATLSVDVDAADLDGDGDLDVLSSSNEFREGREGRIVWHENEDGNGTFGPRRMIDGQGFFFVFTVRAADVDGDHDVDVLVESAFRITTLYENTDGQGTFGRQGTFGPPSPLLEPYPRSIADLDNDGDLDLLSVDNNSLTWHENGAGQGNFLEHDVPDSYGTFSVAPADVDGDGDIDVLSAYGYSLEWYENTDGRGNFERSSLIDTGLDSAVSLLAADVDGDGDMDVISASLSDEVIAWYQNTNGEGTFGPRQVITSVADVTDSVGPYSAPPNVTASVADVDGDGDVDVLWASYVDDIIAWSENTDGRGTFGPPQVISYEGARYLRAADMDGDGDVDVLVPSASGDVAWSWYENRRPFDVNDDGVFNSLDLVHVLEAGKYDTGQPSTFAEGDWNLDGRFDRSDVVAALQAGVYVKPAAP